MCHDFSFFIGVFVTQRLGMVDAGIANCVATPIRGGLARQPPRLIPSRHALPTAKDLGADLSAAHAMGAVRQSGRVVVSDDAAA